MTAPPVCTYSITRNDSSWLTVTSPGTATGNSTVTYNVALNNRCIPRVSVIVVGGRTFTVNQDRFKGVEARRSTIDFNGDRTTDFVAIQNANGNMTWWSYRYHITTSGSTNIATYGLFADDVPVPNDFDADFRADFAVWRPSTGEFYVQPTGGFNMISYVRWGNANMKIPAYSMQVQ